MFTREVITSHAREKGYELKEVQLLSIENVLSKKDTIVIAKTGEGKSLIFQVANSIYNKERVGICIIVSPLVAIMMDQVRTASQWGSAIFLGSAQNDKQAECHLESYRFIFMAPEKLQQSSIQRELKRISNMIHLLVIDEAHTVVTWQGFRPAFSEVPGYLQNIFGQQRPPLLMMTATLPIAQQEQLFRDFLLPDDTKSFRVSCDRDNLSIQIVNPVDKIAQLLKYATESQSRGNLCLVYVATPKDCQALRTSLEQAVEQSGCSPLRIGVYHGAGNTGKLDPAVLAERTETLQLATSRQLDICICTSAFGMGVNIPNIDCVIHTVPPRSLSEYAQQIGRAGRDGNQAAAIMLFHPGHISQCFSLWVANKDAIVMQQNFTEFRNMISFIYSSNCRRKFVRKILENVDESVPLQNTCNCDACEETHIIQRDIAAAMRLLLCAIKEHTVPVCMTRISDKLFGHAPKHKDSWDDKGSPMWGKGKSMFAPTKQSDIWSSLAAVAVYELNFLEASLHSHYAPPAGHVVAYQRFSLSAAGSSFLESPDGQLLVRERFVPQSAWMTIAPRCDMIGCMNKGVYNGMCSKHSALTVAKGSSCGHEAFSQKFVSQPMTPGHEASAPVKGAPSSFPQNFVSQPMTPPPGHEASSTAPGCLKDICLSQPIIADRTASQCTPPGCFTQMGHSSLSSLDPKVPTRNVPEKMYSTAGVYNFALNDDPDILYNPYMGHSYTRTLATGTKVKVHTCRGVYECPSCQYRARPEHKPQLGVALICKICTQPPLLRLIECGVKTTTTINGNIGNVVVDRDHKHDIPPVTKLLPSTKAKIKQMVEEGRQVTGAICNFGQLFPKDLASQQEDRVNARVRKSHTELFGEDLDFGGIPHLMEVIIKEDFVRDAIKDIGEPSKTICFVQTNFQQTVLKTCDYIFGDISYKLCRNYYKMVLTGFNHVTRQGSVVATAFLERADEISYATFFKTLFRHNPTLITVTATNVTFSFEAFCVDFSDAQRKGLMNAVCTVAHGQGCRLTKFQIEAAVFLSLKGCEFHFQQSLTKVAKCGALAKNSFQPVFKNHVKSWVDSQSWEIFDERKKRLLQYFPTVKGWITWWSLPVHAVLIFPGVRAHMLGETDEMYSLLPSTNNSAEAINSAESKLCRHNVELIPSIHDAWRMTLRQQRLHEGLLSGQVKLKVSPTKRPTLVKRRAHTEDWDQRCPDRVGADLSGRPPLPLISKEPATATRTPQTAKKLTKKLHLRVHSDADRCRRVANLIDNNTATPGFFAEAFPPEDRPNDRWFLQITSATITDKTLTGMWCKTDSLTLESSVLDTLHLGSVKDYGDDAMFLM